MRLCGQLFVTFCKDISKSGEVLCSFCVIAELLITIILVFAYSGERGLVHSLLLVLKVFNFYVPAKVNLLFWNLAMQ